MKINKTQMLLQSVTRLLNRNADEHIRRILLKSHASEIASVLRQLSEAESIHVMQQLKGIDKEPKVFVELGGKFLQSYLAQVDDRTHIAEILHDLPENEVAQLVSEMDEATAHDLMPHIQDSTKAEVNEILLYSDDTCGRIMSVDVFSLNQNLTANQAIAAIQNTPDLENIYYVYVVDDFENLVGVVSLRQILQVPSHRVLKDFIIRDVIRVNAFDSQAKAAAYVEEYNFVSLPVVNDEGKLVGRVQVDDVIDFIREEAKDDVFEMAGVEAEAIDRYAFWRAFGSRAAWYSFLFVGGILSSEIILAIFHDYPARIIYLCFAPLVLRLGGSIATQGITFVHQSVLNTDIERGRGFKALLGQSMTTLLVSFLLAVGVFGYGFLRFWPDLKTPALLAAGIMAVSVFSVLVSYVVPVIFSKFKLDSLSVSSRFVHFLMDALSLIVFFNFVWLFY